mgnify:FL=1
MPTNYALRTPIYASAYSTTSGIQSAKLLLNITGVGTPVYTIVKEASSSVRVVFEIAELLRDYLDVVFDGTTYNTNSITFTSTIQFFDQPNAGGSAVGSAISTIGGDGWEAYGLFTDGVNPVLPFENRTRPTWLLAERRPSTGVADDDFYVFVPDGVSGKVAMISYAGLVTFESFNGTDTSITPSTGVKLNITRINCTKYGTGRKITFINKYGVLQDLWFFLKIVKNIKRTNESFQSNTITSNASTVSYSQTDAPKKLFNTQAKQTHTLSSGYYPEYANAYFEELLLSEYVWYTRPEDNQPNSDETIPVLVKTSSMIYKTSLNDRLIEYTIEFEDTFDYINNIR